MTDYEEVHVIYTRSGKTKLWAISVLPWRQLQCNLLVTKWLSVLTLSAKAGEGVALSSCSLSIVNLQGISGGMGGTYNCIWLAAFTSYERRRNGHQQVGLQEQFHKLETGCYFYCSKPQGAAFSLSSLLWILLVNTQKVDPSLFPQRSPSARAGGYSFQPHALRSQ